MELWKNNCRVMKLVLWQEPGTAVVMIGPEFAPVDSKEVLITIYIGILISHIHVVF